MGPDHSKGGHKESSVAIIEQLLADSSVVIFSKSYCPYCAKVKNFFQAPLTSNFFSSSKKPRENKLECFSHLSLLFAGL
jgi:Glutaredoxin